VADLLWGLGPDPLEAPKSWFTEALRARRGPVKAVLLDQGFLAGVGNIYADEALFAAGVRPDRPGRSLSPAEAGVLHGALRRVLGRAVRAQVAGRDARLSLGGLRTEASRNLARTGSPGVGCPRCGRALRASRLGGRTSYWCPRCQR
jgi:formamidopyrimidine-DNA glycosylase